MTKPNFVDEVNPTDDEIRRWAYSTADAPMEDWDIIIASARHGTALIELVADPECPAREFLLGSLYCMVGHSDLQDPQLRKVVELGEQSSDPWVKAWASRAARIVAEPSSRIRDEWCGWGGVHTSPAD